MNKEELKKINEASEIFNDACKKMLDKGLKINGSTMSGSQGEICKVDFTNKTGTKIVRIVMDDNLKFKDEEHGRYYEIIEYHYKKGEDFEDTVSRYRTLWNDDKHYAKTIASIKVSEW